MEVRTRVRLLKGLIWAAGVAPFLYGLHRLFLGDGFSANPIEEIEHYTGDVALVTLLTAVGVTPIRWITGWNDLQKVRRLVGLFAFAYVVLHFLVWLVLDHFFAWSFIAQDIFERPFVTVGFAALLMLLPLALTSTRGWIRRLGRNWVRLHRLVYVASGLAVIHFLWATKADDRWPAVAAVAWASFMAVRIVRARRTRVLRAARPKPGTAGSGSVVSSP